MGGGQAESHIQAKLEKLLWRVRLVEMMLPREVSRVLADRDNIARRHPPRILEEIFAGFERREEIRRPTEGRHDPDRDAYSIPSDDERGAGLRRARFDQFLAAGRSRHEAVALAVGAETWSMGAQLIFVTYD